MKILNRMKLVLVAMFALLLLNSTVYAESAYTLTEVDEPGANVITKYIYDSVSGEVTPVYYDVSLNQTTYGSGEGNISFTIAGVNGGTFTIEAYYNPDDITDTRQSSSDAGFDVSKDFVGVLSDTKNGGAVYNSSSSSISEILVNFIGNSVTRSANEVGDGGAISNLGTIEKISGAFIGNYVSSSDTISGGAIYNEGTINSIDGDFVGNNLCGDTQYGYGGALTNYYNKANIGNINGNFVGNYINANGTASGGAIYNYYGKIGDITGDFINNYIINTGANQSGGGAIYNYDYYTDAGIGNITGDFIGNHIITDGNTADGGAIYNVYGAKIGDVKGDFINNYAKAPNGRVWGGAIVNYGATITSISGDFIGNYAEAGKNAYGGAIYNGGDGVIGSFTNSSFYSNYAQSETEDGAKGGAIYTTTDMNFVSTDGYTMVFSGNYTDSAGTKDDNAIYVDSADATLNFSLSNGGSVVMDDNIRGTSGYKVDIEGDDVDNTTFYMFNDMYSANLSVGGTTLNTVNNEIHTYELNSFSLTGDINMVVDVDLKNETMDRITANSYGDHQGTLTVSGWNLLSDTTEDSVSIYFAEEGLKDYVANGDNNELPTSYQTTAYTPIYKYIVEYDNRDDGGYFVFTKGGGGSGGNNSDSFNPAVLVSSVASQLGAYTALTTTYEYAFEHSNYYMKLPNATRLAMQNGNKYAITENNNTIYQSNEMTDRGMWYRPYTSFESANLKRGPKVDAINYGTLIGGDSDFKEYKNGWGGVFSAYVGYNGSSLSYSGVHTYQNGGLLGVTQTFYKNNFFTALTATAGASVGEASTMYGHENFTMLMAGVASKTGYNLEFKEGRFIVQPSLLLSYSFINTFDYRNAAGVRINSDPLHAIEINPNIRFVMNCRNGWQPYASVGMIWNILDETKVTANNVTLPEMSIRPYVEYGLGIQRLWNDKYGGYLQAMIRNGGRNGVVLTAGFRFKFGKEPKSVKNINGNAISERKVIKQLTPANTVSERKVIKQL